MVFVRIDEQEALIIHERLLALPASGMKAF
jgi:hypothetical protein